MYEENTTSYFLGKFSQNFDLKKKMISTYANDFFMKKMTQICQISKKNNNQIARFLGKVLEGSKEYTRILVFFFSTFISGM
jgi:hypothetical protein